jgi:ketosteroid isomerase-like protein
MKARPPGVAVVMSSGDRAESVDKSAARPVPNRSVTVPVPLTPAGEAREVRMYTSRDEGKTWYQVGVVTPDRERFEYKAPADGVYWFGTRVVFKNGSSLPGPAESISPTLKVQVDTFPPVVRVTATERAGRDVLVRWDASEPGAARVQYRTSAGVGWTDGPARTDNVGYARFPVDVEGSVVLRVGVKDAAGNEGWSAEVAAQAAGEPTDDVAAVRMRSARYANAVRDREPEALVRLLRLDYRGYLPPGSGRDNTGSLSRAEVIAYWVGTGAAHSGLSFKTTTVQMLGGTAVERGSLSGTVGRRNGPFSHVLQDVRYVRVWLKDDAGWRIAHESY